MQKRAARFGTNVAPALTAVEESEKKMKRRDRFGLTTTDLPAEVRTLPALALPCAVTVLYDPISPPGPEASQAGAFWGHLAAPVALYYFPLSLLLSLPCIDNMYIQQTVLPPCLSKMKILSNC